MVARSVILLRFALALLFCMLPFTPGCSSKNDTNTAATSRSQGFAGEWIADGADYDKFLPQSTDFARLLITREGSLYPGEYFPLSYEIDKDGSKINIKVLERLITGRLVDEETLTLSTDDKRATPVTYKRLRPMALEDARGDEAAILTWTTGGPMDWQVSIPAFVRQLSTLITDKNSPTEGELQSENDTETVFDPVDNSKKWIRLPERDYHKIVAALKLDQLGHTRLRSFQQPRVVWMAVVKHVAREELRDDRVGEPMYCLMVSLRTDDIKVEPEYQSALQAIHSIFFRIAEEAVVPKVGDRIRVWGEVGDRNVGLYYGAGKKAGQRRLDIFIARAMYDILK